MPSFQRPQTPAHEVAIPRGAEVIVSLQGLGALISSMRKAQHLRIDDTAALCGVSLDLLFRLEKGQGGVGSDKLLTVLDGLGLAMIIASKQDSLMAGLPQA